MRLEVDIHSRPDGYTGAKVELSSDVVLDAFPIQNSVFYPLVKIINIT